jgi:hypothetical protein
MLSRVRPGSGMSDINEMIDKLTAEQALKIVKRLARKGGVIRAAVIAEATSVLTDIDLDRIADEVFIVLDSIDVQDCWDRSGRSRGRYRTPDEAAAEIIEEELQPFFDQAERYHELGMPEQEAAYCRGVILGIYLFQRETRSEHGHWSVDIAGECAGYLLDKWRERNREKAGVAAMHQFVRERCPEWAGMVRPPKG